MPLEFRDRLDILGGQFDYSSYLNDLCDCSIKKWSCDSYQSLSTLPHLELAW